MQTVHRDALHTCRGHGPRRSRTLWPLRQIAFGLSVVLLTVGHGRSATWIAEGQSAPRGDVAVSLPADPVLRGLSARERLARSLLDSFKAEWRVNTHGTLGTRISAPSSPGTSESPQARIGEMARTEATEAVVTVLVDGERYRVSRRIVRSARSSAPALFDKGYDGRAAWMYTMNDEGERDVSEFVERAPLSRMGELVYLGLYGVLGDPAGEMSASLRDKGARVATQERLQGHDCYVVVVSGTHPHGGSTVTKDWVSSDLGYAIVRRSYESSNSRTRQEFSRFRQVGPGLWLPYSYQRVSETRTGSGKWSATSSETAQLETFQLDPKLVDSQFRLPR